MKNFDPNNDTCVFELDSLLSLSSGNIGISYELLRSAIDEIKLLRARLEIDSFYAYDDESDSFQEVISTDNKMLGTSDKIECLETEIRYLCSAIMSGKGKEFVRNNFPDLI